MTEQRITVAIHVEILPDEGPCYYCGELAPPWSTDDCELFAVRAQNASESPVLATCGYHLQYIFANWDHLPEVHVEDDGMEGEGE